MPRRFQRAAYRVRVASELDSMRGRWLGAIDLENVERGMTELTTDLIDQASLHVLLARIRDLNLTLMTVERLTEEE